LKAPAAHQARSNHANCEEYSSGGEDQGGELGDVGGDTGTVSDGVALRRDEDRGEDSGQNREN
jgi:hypothetical protein